MMLARSRAIAAAIADKPEEESLGYTSSKSVKRFIAGDEEFTI
jgi:hypothetical protein